jgi:hypothetical protein
MSVDTTLLVSVAIGISLATVLAWIGLLSLRRPRKKPKLEEAGRYFHGPALTGTARVLSMTPLNRPGLSGKGQWQIELRVEVPGLRPYAATTAQILRQWAVIGVRRSDNIVTVEVDSDHPERVRVGDSAGRWYG